MSIRVLKAKAQSRRLVAEKNSVAMFTSKFKLFWK